MSPLNIEVIMFQWSIVTNFINRKIHENEFTCNKFDDRIWF